MGRRHAPIDLTPDQFRALGHRLVDHIGDFLDSLPARAVAPGLSPSQARARLGPRGMPDEGADPTALVDDAARLLFEQFGKPDSDVQEGPARKLQFAGPVCILDAYLYPRAGGGEPVVTYLDARQPDGRDFDRASCVAALSRRPEAR